MSATITFALELSLLPNSILLLLYFVLLLLYFYVTPPLKNQTPSGREICTSYFVQIGGIASGDQSYSRLRLPELSFSLRDPSPTSSTSASLRSSALRASELFCASGYQNIPLVIIFFIIFPYLGVLAFL